MVIMRGVLRWVGYEDGCRRRGALFITLKPFTRIPLEIVSSQHILVHERTSMAEQSDNSEGCVGRGEKRVKVECVGGNDRDGGVGEGGDDVCAPVCV